MGSWVFRGIAWTQSVENSKLSPSVSDAIDKTGRIIFSVQARGIFKFHYGLAKIYQNVHYGFIDKTGKFVIPSTLLAAEDFVDGRATVCLEGWHQETINTLGLVVRPVTKSDVPRLSAHGTAHYDDKKQLIFKPRTASPHEKDGLFFSEGLAHVFFVRPGTNVFSLGLIDPSNRIVLELPNSIKECGIFSDGVAPVGVEIDGLDEFHERQAQRLGFIDTKGAMVIPPIYDEPIDGWWTGHRINEIRFHDGVALVQWHHTDCYIDRAGKIIRCLRAVNCEGFNEGLAAVNVLVDSEGKEVDLFDNSHGFQNLYDYELELFRVLRAGLSTIRSSRPIKFKIIEPAETPVKVEFLEAEAAPKDIVDKMRGTIRNLHLPPRGVFLDEAFSFTFSLEDGQLTCNYGSYRGREPLPPPPSSLPPSVLTK